jgi:tetratricopeptide (TPR) repeat protein
MSSLTNQRRAARWVIALAAFGAIAAGAAALGWWPFRAVAVPAIPVEDVDPELADAVRKARAAVVHDPGSGLAWGELGKILLANEMYPEIAIVCFHEAQRRDPANPRWPYYAGAIVWAIGNLEEAIPDLRRAAGLCATAGVDATTPRLLLAEALLADGQSDAAEKEIRRVLTEEPQSRRAYFTLGMVAYGRGEWQRCRIALEACVSTPSAAKRASMNLATVCEQLGDRASAERYAKMAQRLPKDKDWPDPLAAEYAPLTHRKPNRYGEAEQLEKEGRLTEAAKHVERLIQQYPDDYIPHLMMGRILGPLDQFERAEHHLREALRLAPDKVQIRYVLAMVYQRRGEMLAVTKRPDHPEARASFEAAARTAREALALRADDGVAHMMLGLALKALGRRADALAELRQAVQWSPDIGELHRALGLVLVEDARSGEARSHLEEAVRLAGPDDPRPQADLDRYFPDPSRKSAPGRP